MDHIEYSMVLDDPYSCFEKLTSKKHITLPPKYLGNIKKGIEEQLDSKLAKYSHR